MKTTLLCLERNEKHMLLGLLAVMYQAAESTEDKGAAWVVIGQKLRNPLARYTEGEVELLKLAVESTLTAGDRMLGRLPADDAARRLRAGVVKQTYIAIKGRLDDAKWEERQLSEKPENLRGDDQGREDPQGDPLLLSGGSATDSAGSNVSG